jgi:hypothetical protein
MNIEIINTISPSTLILHNHITISKIATNGKRKLHVLDIEKTSIKQLSQCAFRGITRNSKILEKIAHEQFSLKMYSIHDLKSLFTEIQTLFNMHFSYISC